jgi:hypothetical protein
MQMQNLKAGSQLRINRCGSDDALISLKLVRGAEDLVVLRLMQFKPFDQAVQ